MTTYFIKPERKYLVLDSSFNRYWQPQLIGKVYDASKVPSYTQVQELNYAEFKAWELND